MLNLTHTYPTNSVKYNTIQTVFLVRRLHLQLTDGTLHSSVYSSVLAWHHLINCTQAQHLKSVQKRAIHIIFNFTHGMSYPNILFVTQLDSLETRRNNLSKSFFQDICKPTSCLHHFIPPLRDTSVTTRLRLTTSLPRPNLRTKKYCSFINFGLHHYQPT